jgi:hypothetical protein
LPLPGALVLALAVLCGAIYPAVMQAYPFLWVPVFAVCTLCLLRVVRGIVPLLAAALIYIVGLFLGTATLGTALLGVLCAVALYALLITLTRSTWLLLLPVAAYVLAWVLSGSYALALLVLIPFPAAAALAWGTMKNDGRVSVICSTAGALLVCVLLAIAAFWYEVEHELTMESYVRAFDALRAEFTRIAQEQANETAQYNEMLAQLGYDYTVEILIDTTLQLIMLIMPALLIVSCSIFAYTAQLLCIRGFAGCGASGLMTKTAQLFVMSVPSALIYLFAFFSILFNLLFSDRSGVFITVMLNLLLILMPGMCIVGAWKLYADYRRRPSVFVLLVILATAFFMPPMLPICIALSGAFTTLVRPIVAKMIAEGFDPHEHDKD